VGIWIIVCVQKPSHHFLQTFRPLRMFMIVIHDSSLYSETIAFILSSKADQRGADTVAYQFLYHDRTVARA